jgi:DnaJ-class molecular chaperone
MVAGTERLTARKGAIDSRSDDVSLRQAPGQGSHESDCGEVSCAFCHGTGTDPFGILSWLSTCCVCKGIGIVHVQGPQESCAHCRGTGAVKRLTCTVCGGKGLVPLRVGDTVVCPKCQGTGDDFSASAIPCLKCRGRGWVVLDA